MASSIGDLKRLFFGGAASPGKSLADLEYAYYSTPISGSTLPTADPHVNGAVWNNVGVVTVSAG